MKCKFTILGLALLSLLVVSIAGCGPMEDDPITLLSASPSPGSTIRPQSDITLTFDGVPENLRVNGEEKIVSFSTLTMSGPFKPGELELKITWTGGAETVKYTVDGALFKSADPAPGSTISPFETITVTFDGNPKNLFMLIHNRDYYSVSGNKLTIDGIFEPGPLELNVVWEDGTKTLNYNVSYNPIAKIENVRVDHNVFGSGDKGMRIYVDFNVANMYLRDGRVAAYFYFQDGTPLKDFNQKFRTTNGNVSVGDNFSAPFTISQYEDFSLFMPYNELHMTQGKFNLKFQVRIYERGGDFLDNENYYVSFTFTK